MPKRINYDNEPIVKRPKSRSIVEQERIRIVDVVLAHARTEGYCTETIRTLFHVFVAWQPYMFEKPEVQEAWETMLNAKRNENRYAREDLYERYEDVIVKLFRDSQGFD